jgi:hypothetical protein
MHETMMMMAVQCCIGSLRSVSVPRRDVATICPIATFNASATSWSIHRRGR